MDELKPCPFCGSEGQVNDHVLKTSSGHYTADAQCSSCNNVVIDQVYATSRQEAVAGAALVWNTRKPEPPALVWSSERPKVEGWYFVRFAAPEFRRAPWTMYADAEYLSLTEFDEVPSNCQFAGPIPEPKEASL